METYRQYLGVCKIGDRQGHAFVTVSLHLGIPITEPCIVAPETIAQEARLIRERSSSRGAMPIADQLQLHEYRLAIQRMGKGTRTTMLQLAIV